MRFWCCIALLVLLFCVCHSAHADGGYVPKIDARAFNHDITEPTQKAVLVHCDGQERLILQVSYRGDVSEFVWLVPTPAKPHIAMFDFPVFHQLEWETAPRIRYWLSADAMLDEEFLLPILAHAGSRRGKTAKPVNVLERKQIGVYDVAVLSARRADDLVAWLRGNHYQVNRKIEAVLSDYIKRGWFFTATRINTKRSKAEAALREGTLHALQFDFAAPQPIYPLKISSLNPGTTKILLYVCALHAVKNGLTETVCVQDGSHAVAWADLDMRLYRQSDGDWRLTKLSGDFTPEQMTHDLTLAPAKNDKLFRAAEVSPPFFENLGALCGALIVVPFMFPFNIVTGVICYFIAEKARKGSRLGHVTGKVATYCLFSWIVSPVIGLCFLPLRDFGYWPITPIVACVALAIWLVRRARSCKMPDTLTSDL